MFNFYFFYLGLWFAALSLGLIWWVGLLQQKEYRFDRLLAHLRSLGLIQVVILVLPVITCFKPKLFKRPVRTFRALIVLFLSVLTLSYGFFAALPWTQMVAALTTTRLFVLPFLLYVSAPIVVLLFTSLTSFAVWLVTQWQLFEVARAFRTKKIFVIGITGSFGKTTTKQLLAHVLSGHGFVFSTPGSVNTALGIARFLKRNMPESGTLVLEYAAYQPGEIARIAAVIPPDLAILTGLGKQHLELFGSLERIKSAKAELLEALPENARVFCANESALEIVAAAKNKQALQVEKTWVTPEVRVRTAIVGDHYKNTLKVVTAVARNLGFSQAQIEDGLRSFVPGKNWIQSRSSKSGAKIVDDSGTSNPDGFLAALRLLAEQPEKRKILVTAGIVDLGVESEAIHDNLAREATAIVSEVWYLGETGKERFALRFAGKILTDRQEILERAQTLAADSCVLLEGRMPLWFSKVL